MTSPRETARERGGRAGRRVALAIYWAFTLWLASTALISVIPQVFWPAEARGEAPATVANCDEALETLFAQLLTGASDELATLADRPPPDAGPFLDAWDERYRSLHMSCGDRRAYPLLHRLRHALGTELGRALTVAPLARETRAALDLDASSTSP